MFLLRSVLLCATGLFVTSTYTISANAAPSRFLDEGAFNAATMGLTFSTVDFESATAGDIISDGSTFDGLTFTYGGTLAADELIIADGAFAFDPVVPSSGDNYLGGDVDDLIFDDRSFELSVPTGFNALSFRVLTPDELVFDDDIQVTVGGQTFDITNLAQSNRLTRVDGMDTDFEYFFSIVDVTTPFASVTIAAPDLLLGTGFFGIDDIQFASAATAVPEPGSLAFLTMTAISGLGVYRRSRRSLTVDRSTNSAC